MRKKSIPELTPEQVERFWNNVEVPEQPSCCWEWTARLSKWGYGNVTIGKHGDFAAHRVAYTLLIGPIPNDLEIDHLCRNRRCVNPDHHEIVTHRENSLRGYGPTAINFRKTHCIHGHELTPDNVRFAAHRPTERECRTCWRERKTVRYLRERKITTLRPTVEEQAA